MSYLTTKETAEKLGVSTGRIRQMVIAGQLHAEKFGRELMINETDIETVRNRKTGRPKKTENVISETNGNKKPFKTIFDIEARLAEKLAGSLDSGLGDLSTNKKYMEGFGTKEGEKRALLKRNENNR